MNVLRTWSIRSKLTAIIVVSTIVPLTAGLAVVVMNDVRALKRELADATVLMARVTAENSVTDVAFSDEESSARTLSKLASIPNMRWAAIYDKQGRMFSMFAPRGVRPPSAPPPGENVRLVSATEIRATAPILYAGERYGTLYLCISTEALRAKVRDHLLTLLLVMAAVVFAAIVLAMRLEKIVSAPILELAALAREISTQHDYSARATPRSEDEVGALAEDFNEMLRQIEKRQLERDEADQRTREKSQFLANMSHELRTPLNAIIGFSEVLRTRLSGHIQEREERFLDNINSSGQHLLGIVNDILDLSKIEAGRMEVSPETFQLRNAVEGVCSLMRGVSSRKNVSIEIDVEQEIPDIEADPVKVKQILYNLLSNAVKFSPERSTVTIRARHLPESASPLHNDCVQIRVTDQGIGIDPKDHKRIFDEFQQVDSTISRQFEGTGLGLTLVKRFVDVHAGAIDLESALGRGSTFTVTLPLRFRGIGLTPEVPREPAVSSHRLVLVVEDDDHAYRAIEERLVAAGYVPHHARTGEEGIAFARELHPVAITLDLILPGIDGIEVLKTLKSDPSTRSIPVIIVSVMDNRELGFAFGAFDYLVKPVEPERVVEALERIDHRRNDKLLVIDDDPALHDMLDDSLRSQGYELLHAYGASEGVVRASTEQPALVILDLMMQGMIGFDVAARLNDDPRTASLPIVIVTSKELSGGDRLRLKGKVQALVERGELSGNRLVDVIRELVQP